MSSTNRNGLARQPHDFYETPPAVVDAVLDELAIGPEYAGMVLDPGCGNGIILSRVYARAPKAETYGVDIQGTLVEQARARNIPTANIAEGDFLALPVRDVDLVIANPPYKLALPFVERALSCVARRKGTVAMLLPEGFKASHARYPFHLAHPSDVIGLVPRPSFNGGGTDSCEYAWFIWGRGRGGRWHMREWRAPRGKAGAAPAAPPVYAPSNVHPFYRPRTPRGGTPPSGAPAQVIPFRGLHGLVVPSDPAPGGAT